MIKVEIKSKNNGLAELKVKAAAKGYHQDKKPTGIFAMQRSLIGTYYNLLNDIVSIPKTNVHVAEFAYKILKAEDKTGQHLIVQHYTVAGDPDRVVAIIRDDEQPYNNWVD